MDFRLITGLDDYTSLMIACNMMALLLFSLIVPNDKTSSSIIKYTHNSRVKYIKLQHLLSEWSTLSNSSLAILLKTNLSTLISIVWFEELLLTPWIVIRPVVARGENVSRESIEASSSLYKLLVALFRPRV